MIELGDHVTAARAACRAGSIESGRRSAIETTLASRGTARRRVAAAVGCLATHPRALSKAVSSALRAESTPASRAALSSSFFPKAFVNADSTLEGEQDCRGIT